MHETSVRPGGVARRFLYQQVGRLPDAARVLKTYRDGPRKDDAPKALHARYGMVLSEMRRPKEAVGVFAFRKKKLHGARTHFQRALEVKPKLPDPLNGLAAAELALEDLDVPLAAWLEALSVNPRNLEALYNLGTSAAQAARLEEAEALQRYLAVFSLGRFARERAEVQALLRSLAEEPRNPAR